MSDENLYRSHKSDDFGAAIEREAQKLRPQKEPEREDKKPFVETDKEGEPSIRLIAGALFVFCSLIAGAWYLLVNYDIVPREVSARGPAAVEQIIEKPKCFPEHPDASQQQDCPASPYRFGEPIPKISVFEMKNAEENITVLPHRILLFRLPPGKEVTIEILSGKWSDYNLVKHDTYAFDDYSKAPSSPCSASGSKFGSMPYPGMWMEIIPCSGEPLKMRISAE